MRRIASALALWSSMALLAAACGSDVVETPTGAGGTGGGGPSSTGAGTDASSTAAGEEIGAPCDAEGSLRCEDNDTGAFLQCKAGAYAKVGDCEAGEACQNVQGADAVACGGLFVGIEGTPCIAAVTQVCDLSREVVLGCDAGTWATFIHCNPGACTDIPAEAGQLCSGIACENCGYTVGDRCSFPTGSVNCSTDTRQIVGCDGGIVTLFEDCASQGLACTRNGGTLECR